MKEGEEIPALVLLVSTLFADDHQIVEDEQCPLVSLAKVRTSAQIQDFIDVALQNKTTLRSGEFLEGEREKINMLSRKWFLKHPYISLSYLGA